MTATHEPDLFWALRGGRGNFGVVVSLELDLVPVTRLYGGGLWFGGDSVAPALHAYADWVADLPDEMGSSVLLIRMPDVPGVPDPLRGEFVAHVRIAWSGPAGRGEELVRPLRDAAPVLVDTVGDMPYCEVGTIHDEPTSPVPFQSRNSMLGAPRSRRRRNAPRRRRPRRRGAVHGRATSLRRGAGPPCGATQRGRTPRRPLLPVLGIGRRPRRARRPPRRPPRPARGPEPVGNGRRVPQLPGGPGRHHRRA